MVRFDESRFAVLSLFLSSVLSEAASFLTLLWFDREASPQESCMEALSPDTGSTELEIYQTLGLKESRKGVFKTPRVLMLLSSLLERSVQKNEILMEKTQSKDVVTIFHGLRPPPVSIRQYVDRIFKYSACSPSCFVVAHVYVDRFLQQTDIHLTSLNVHRLLITSVMIAAKFVDDAFFNNGYYARVGGVSTEELNSFIRNIIAIRNVKINASPVLMKLEAFTARLSLEHQAVHLEASTARKHDSLRLACLAKWRAPCHYHPIIKVAAAASQLFYWKKGK